MAHFVTLIIWVSCLDLFAPKKDLLNPYPRGKMLINLRVAVQGANYYPIPLQTKTDHPSILLSSPHLYLLIMAS